MVFNDDERIVLPPNSGPKPTVPGRVQLVIRHNPTAPLEENIHTVMLELTGGEESRSGLDLVTVLDVSGSMQGEKIEQLKKAMRFVMKKLDIVDRLSIVKYSNNAKRLCPLRQITDNSRTEFDGLIKDLEAGGKTNITEGLQTALDILKDRTITTGRVGVIMLMSDGEQNRGGDAAQVQVGDVPVHTFGFGDDQDANVLKAIAENSQLGGTYSDVRMEKLSLAFSQCLRGLLSMVHTFRFGNNQDAKVLKAIAENSQLGGTYSDVRMANLSLAFSQCLGGLLSVVAQDLTVTVTRIDKESNIRLVSAGMYPQIPDNTDDSVTIRFGDLYIQEGRKVLIKILLPAIDKEQDADILEVSYTYKFDGQLYEANPATVTVCRLRNLTAGELQEPPEVRAEVVRLLIADLIKQATNYADNKQLDSARNKLSKVIKILRDVDTVQLKAGLRAELEQLVELMETQPIYDSRGRHFAYSSLVSHATQRQAARGDDIGKFQLFATPAMQEFVAEAKKFQDINELNDYMQEAINAFQSIEKIIDKV